jgi:hypothetical protein
LNVHCSAAFTAAALSKGCPVNMRAHSTFPSGLTSTSTATVPSHLQAFGNFGMTRLMTLSLISLAETLTGFPFEMKNNFELSPQISAPAGRLSRWLADIPPPLRSIKARHAKGILSCAEAVLIVSHRIASHDIKTIAGCRL